MYRSFILISVCILLCTRVTAQLSLDGTYRQNGIAQKKYALYLPTYYSKGKSMPVLIAFHPLQSLKWNPKSWRNHLISFADKHGVILICPEANQTSRQQFINNLDFAKKLTLNILDRYDIQPSCIYSLGSEWGGKSALGLAVRHRNFVDGLILISTNYQSLQLSREAYNRCFNLPCFLIHGEADQLSHKFYPLKKNLNQSGACVNSHLVKGAGNQISLEGKQSILSRAFLWLENQNCNKPEIIWKEGQKVSHQSKREMPEFQVAGLKVKVTNIRETSAIYQISIYNKQGILVKVIRDPLGEVVIQLPSGGDYTFAFQSKVRTNHFLVSVK